MSTGRKTLTNSRLYIEKCECPDNRNSGDNVHFDSGWIMNLETPNSLCEALRGSGSKLSATGISPLTTCTSFLPAVIRASTDQWMTYHMDDELWGFLLRKEFRIGIQLQVNKHAKTKCHRAVRDRMAYLVSSAESRNANKSPDYIMHHWLIEASIDYILFIQTNDSMR